MQDHETAGAAAPVFLNRGELARAMGVTPPTIDAWVADGCPVAEHGSNGKPYKFDLAAVKAWREDVERAQEEERRRKEELIGQQQLALDGGALGESEMALSPAKRKEFWEERVAYMKAAELRGELVRAADVEAQLEEMFKFLGQALQGLPDVLARKCALGPDAITLVQKAVDDWQAELAKKLMREERLEFDRVA